MKFYRVMSGGAGDLQTMGFELRSEPGAGPVWPEGQWSPLKAFTDRAIAETAPLAEEFADNLRKTTAVVRTKADVLSDIVGAFDASLMSCPPIVSPAFKALLDEVAHESCEYFTPPQIWNALTEEFMAAPDYVLANIVCLVDGWDIEKTDLSEMMRNDGSRWYSLGARAAVDPSKVENVHFWRDGKTMHVLCSEVFKSRAEAQEISNIYFLELTE